MSTSVVGSRDGGIAPAPQTIAARVEPRPHVPFLMAPLLAVLLLFMNDHIPGAAHSARTFGTLTVLVLGAMTFFLTLDFESRRRAAALSLLAVPILLSPLLVTADAFSRMVLALVAGLLAMKLYDVHVGAALGRRLDLRSYVSFLPNFYLLVQRRVAHEVRPRRAETLLRLGLTALGLAVAFPAVRFVFGLDWRSLPFLVEHAVKVPVFAAWVFLAMAGSVHLVRLVGWRARDFTAAPLLARTPAEFWRRYNRIVGQFLFENVFKRSGGFRSPRWAILLAFAVSGLLHEYLLAVTLLRIEGYQLLFFLVQGVAVAATARAKPRGWTVVPCLVLTWVFLILSSVPFFVSFHHALGFYAGEVPARLW